MQDNYDTSPLLKKKSKRLNSKAKGNRFERQVVDILNKRFNTTDFCRTPGSGAFATTHKLPEHLQVYGDLVTPKNFRFTFELKAGYNKESVESLFNPKSQLRQFIEQAERDSTKAKKDWIIILKQNNKDPICILEDIQDYNNKNYEFIRYKKYMLLSLESLLALSDDWFYTK